MCSNPTGNKFFRGYSDSARDLTRLFTTVISHLSPHVESYKLVRAHLAGADLHFIVVVFSSAHKTVDGAKKYVVSQH